VRFENGVSFITFCELHLMVADDFGPVLSIVPFGKVIFSLPGCQLPPGSMTCTSPLIPVSVAVTGMALSFIGATIAIASRIAPNKYHLSCFLVIKRPPNNCFLRMKY